LFKVWKKVFLEKKKHNKLKHRSFYFMFWQTYKLKQASTNGFVQLVLETGRCLIHTVFLFCTEKYSSLTHKYTPKLQTKPKYLIPKNWSQLLNPPLKSYLKSLNQTYKSFYRANMTHSIVSKVFWNHHRMTFFSIHTAVMNSRWKKRIVKI